MNFKYEFLGNMWRILLLTQHTRRSLRGWSTDVLMVINAVVSRQFVCQHVPWGHLLNGNEICSLGSAAWDVLVIILL